MSSHPLHRALAALGYLDPRAKRRIVLPPDLVEYALAREPHRRFTREEQAMIVRGLADPSVVNWPEYWEVRGR